MRNGSSLVRVWAAAEPGALGREFVHYNVTFGAIGHAQDMFVSQIVPMNSSFRTVDLVMLEREKKAAELASIVVREGTYYGLTFRVTDATVGFSEVVGNKDGEEVTKIREQHANPNLAQALLRVTHFVPAETVVDLYLEINLRRSLTGGSNGYSHSTYVTGMSVYVNGVKSDEERFDGTEPGTPRASSRVGGGQDTTHFPGPIARFYIDDSKGKRIYDAFYPSRRAGQAVGLGEDVVFTADAYSRVSQGGKPLPIRELVWNFGDGTTAAGPEVTKNFTHGGLYEVSLTARDDLGLVGRQFGSIFVPYRADESLHQEVVARAGTLLVGSGTVRTDSSAHTVMEKFVFPQDLEEGDVRIGGYRVVARFSDPTGSLSAPATTMRLHIGSAHIDHEVVGRSPLMIETAGVPFYRGPMRGWVGHEVDVTLELLTGADVSYDLTVEALYFENMSRGFDPHPAHRHGEWLFGPDYRNLRIDGSVAPSKDE